MTPTSATTLCLETPPSRSAAARLAKAGGTTARSMPVLFQEEVQRRTQVIQCIALWSFCIVSAANPATFCFSDDFNQLCPHGSGLLPVSSRQALGDSHPFIGTLHSRTCILTYFIDILEHTKLRWLRKVQCQPVLFPTAQTLRARVTDIIPHHIYKGVSTAGQGLMGYLPAYLTNYCTHAVL